MPISPPAAAPDEILVRFKGHHSRSEKDFVHAKHNARRDHVFRSVSDLELVKIQPGTKLVDAIQGYRKDSEVLYAEPNYLVHAFGTPGDPYFPQQWDLKNTGQNGGTSGADIKAAAAWDITTGDPNVVVAVIDTGIDPNHEDLAANIFTNAADCNSDGVDDDNDGYVDDCHGVNVIDPSITPWDNVGHGTHVSGTIGAVGNNGHGVAGVAWNVKILPCKFLGPFGGTTADAIKCLDYVKAMKDRGVNIIATNNSWGGGDYSQALYDAINEQEQAGILFIAAAGNSGLDNDVLPNYPSNYALPNVIAVAATDNKDQFAWFSNYGTHTVSIAAPGVNIISTTPWSSYGVDSGTSMATPHVTGLAVLLKAQNPARDWKTIRNLILAGGDPDLGAKKTWTGRRLNAYGSLTCTNSAVHARILPAASRIAVNVGTPVPIAYLNINCGVPVAPVNITIQQTGVTVSLLDDGAGYDQESSDGIFSTAWVPNSPGIFTLQFPNGDNLVVDVDINYTPSSTPFQYRNISGTDLDLSDDSVALVYLPFPVKFGGGTSDHFFVSANGVISFEDYFLGWKNVGLPTTAADSLVAPFWDDLVPVKTPVAGTDQNVFVALLGTAPNREIVVEWRNLMRFDCVENSSTTVSFQTVFQESTGNILFNYADAAFGPGCSSHDNGGGATAGIQIGSNVARQFSFNQPLLSSGSGLLWSLTVNPVPKITSLAPTSAFAGASSVNLTVNGSNFLPSSVLRWNGSDLTTTYVSSTSLRATVPGTDLAHAGLVPVTTYNPGPGGGTSNALNFTLNSPNAIVLTSPTAGSIFNMGDTLTVNWDYSGSPGGAVRIELYKNGVLTNTLTTSTSVGSGGHGIFEWVVPGTVNFANNYQLRIVSTTNSTIKSIGPAFQINGRGVVVVSPNGGETFVPGTQNTIAWQYFGSIGTAVGLQLYRGGVFQSTIASNTPIGSNGQGSFSWNVPAAQPLANTYRVRVASTSNATYNDKSDADFSIQHSSIVVTSPNGGELWRPGMQPTVSWGSIGLAGSTVSIDLLQNGSLLQNLASGVPVGNGTGSQQVTVPNLSGSGFSVRVTSEQDATFTDVSNAFFTIGDLYRFSVTQSGALGGHGTIVSLPAALNCTAANCQVDLGPTNATITFTATPDTSEGGHSFTGWGGACASFAASPVCNLKANADQSLSAQFAGPSPGITVVYPNGGETLKPGLNAIQWTYSGVPSAIGSAVKIELYKAGALKQAIVASTPIGTNGTGSYSWNWPASLPIGLDYQVKITATANSTYNDLSDSNFRYNGTGIIVTSPNGGEYLQPGNIGRTISWIYGGSLGSTVNIQLLKGTTSTPTVKTIASGVSIGSANAGSFTSWNIPASQASGSDYKIKIIAASASSNSDVSNNYFTITPTSITVTSPNGGELWRPGMQPKVSWSLVGPAAGSTVRLDLLQNGAVVQNLATGVPIGNGTATQQITVPNLVGNNFTVSVTSEQNAAFTDVSNAPLTIGDLYRITVSQSGAQGGHGTVSVAAAGIDCVAACQFNFGPSGAPITFSAVPDSTDGGHTFIGWSGACAPFGTNPVCTLNANADLLASAGFAGPTPTINVVSPNGGETWAAGSHVITWNYGGVPSVVGSAVKIELLKGGLVQSTLTASAPIGSNGVGSYNWALPSGLNMGQYRVRVSSTAPSGPSDASDADFTVSGPGVQVVSPNGGELWAPGSQQTIRWNYAPNSGSTVNLQLYDGPSYLVTTMASNVPIGANGSGSYLWTVPANLGISYTYMVKVISTANTSYNDLSDNPFGIFANGQTLTVTAPSHGRVTSQPPVIDCGALCTITLPQYTGIDLIAVPDPGYVFGGWGGACNGFGNCVPLLISSQTVSATFLPATVFPPNQSDYVRLDSDPSGIAFDPVRNLAFASNRNNSRIDVISTVDHSRVAQIPLPNPQGIVRSPDDKILVASIAGYIAVIDPDALQVIDQIPFKVTAGSQFDRELTVPEQLAIGSNGSVYIGAREGNTTARGLVKWDRTTNVFSGHTPNNLFLDLGTVAPSADGSKIFVGSSDSGGQLDVYDTASDSVTASKQYFGSFVFQIAANPTGTQFAVRGAGNNTITFLDSNLQEVGTVSMVNYGTTGYGSVLYSPDGKWLYVGAAMNAAVILVIDTQTFSVIGEVPDLGLMGHPSGNTPMTFDQSGNLMGAIERGMSFVDMRNPGNLSTTRPTVALPNFVSPEQGPLGSPTQISVTGQNFAGVTRVQVGSHDASFSVVSPSALSVTAPASSTPGSANIHIDFSSGWFAIVPDGFNYGPTIFYLWLSGGPTTGTNQVVIYGYGFGFQANQMQVFFGETPAEIVGVSTYPGISPDSLPYNLLTVNAPAHAAGTVDVTLKTPAGDTTLKGGFTYVQAPRYKNASHDLEQVIFDRFRNRAYMTDIDTNSVQVFDVATRTFLQPIPTGQVPIGLALSADGSRLAIANYRDGTVTVANPDSISDTFTVRVVDRNDYYDNFYKRHPETLGIASNGRIYVPLSFEGYGCGGAMRVIDLSDHSVTNDTSLYCITETTLVYPNHDNTKLFFADGGDSGGRIAIFDAGTATFTNGSSGIFNFDFAAAGDATVLAAQRATMDSSFKVISYGTAPERVNWPFCDVYGEKLDDSGALLFVPCDTFIDIYDTHHGVWVKRIATPERVTAAWDSLALDSTNARLFILSRSGFTVMDMAELPLSIGTLSPTPVSVGQLVTIRGTGFNKGTALGVNGSPLTPIFIDSQTLQFAVPSLSPGKYAVQLTNQDGISYRLDAALIVN